MSNNIAAFIVIVGLLTLAIGSWFAVNYVKLKFFSYFICP